MDAASAVTTIMGDYASVEQWQTEIYLDLHRNPELSMQEVRTRGVIARELEALGYRVDKIGGGLVGTLDNGPGATVMLRADFDALPVREEPGHLVLAQVTAAVVDVEAEDPVGGRVQHRGERVGDRPAQDRRAQHGAHQHTPGLDAQ